MIHAPSLCDRTGGLLRLGSVIGHLLSRAVLQPLLSRNVFARNRRDLGIPAGEDPWDPTVPFDGVRASLATGLLLWP